LKYKSKEKTRGSFVHSKRMKFVALCRLHPVRTRVISLMLLVTFVASLMLGTYEPMVKTKTYDISSAKSLIGEPVDQYAEKLVDNKQSGFVYNQEYSPNKDVAGESNSPKVTVNFEGLPSAKVSIIDPQNKVDLGFTPKFKVRAPQKDANRVIYPLVGKSAALIYTLKSTGFKEDIVLFEEQGDTFETKYDLTLAEGTEARLESDGSLGVYGAPAYLLGNVSASTDKDAELLKTARTNSEKKTLLFRVPAPFVVESGKKASTSAVASFSLAGTELTVNASGLKNAQYPLSIDPSVYVETAQKLKRGNNETNIDFDVNNELIQKSKTTGARIDYWSDSTEMSAGLFDQAMATSSGFVYRAGGRSDPTMPYLAGQQVSSQATAAPTFTMNMPAIRPAGDLYVALVARVGTGAITPPAGWTVIGGSREISAFYRLGTNVSGGNEAASYNWTIATGVEWTGTILRVKNFNSGTILSGAAATTNGTSTSLVPVQYPAITPANDASLIIRASGINSDKPSEATWLPLGHTRIISGSSSANVSSVGIAASYVDVPSAATVATPVANFVLDGILIDTYGSISFAITPGTSTPGPQSKVEWASFNNTTNAIDSPNPGTGVCPNWCNNVVYDLPANRQGMSMVAYNGYLYAVGGSTDGTAANVQTNVWVAKLGANGEPQLWHPSGGTPVYWYTGTVNPLPTAISYGSMVAYNNRMYITGGRNAAGTSLNTVLVADLLPTGDIGPWLPTGMQLLPDARHAHSVHIYNDVMYVIGGNSNGTLRGSVFYSKLTQTGTMNPWTLANNFTTPRASMGGQMTALIGGYLYLAGGCSALTGAFCSTIASDVQLASINADGTLAPWNSILNLSNQRIGYTLMAWEGGLYRFGGCNRQNTTNGACFATHQSTEFGVINPDGDASTVSNSQTYNAVLSGTNPCSGFANGSPSLYNCNLPNAGDGAGQGGQMSSMVVVNNGYIYNIGGCTDTSSNPDCITGAGMSGNTSYAALDPNGRIVAPPTCPSGQYDAGSWCVDNTRPIYNPTISTDVGTITQAGTTVTGVGTNFQAADVGRTLVYDDGTSTRITARASTTSVTVLRTIAIGTAQNFQVTVPQYAAGTITQAANTITGTGFVAAHVGSTLVYADGTTALITAQASTTLTVNVSKTITVGETFSIYINGLGAGSATVFNNRIYITGGTSGTAGWTSNMNYVGLNPDGSLNGRWRTIAAGAGTSQSGLPTGNFPGIGSGPGIGYSYSFTRSIPASAGSIPGNLYLVGGCIGAGGIGCNNTDYSSGVYKCTILITGEIRSCSTTGQMQIDADTINTGVQGLGLMAGTIYANRIYLVGGACTVVNTPIAPTNPCSNVGGANANRKETIYARLDNTNNIVSESTGLATGNWLTASAIMNPVRRRSMAFGYNGYIYSLAGFGGSTSLQDLLFGKVNVTTGDVESPNGTGLFDSSGVVVTPRWDLRTVVSNGYVYAIGGCKLGAAPDCTGGMEPVIQTFQLYNNDNGAPSGFTTGTDIGVDRIGGSATVMNGYVYYAGGCSDLACTTPSANTYFAAIDSTGAIGAWTAGGALPVALAWGKLMNAGGSLYYVGGQTGSAVTTAVGTVYYTSGIVSGNPTWTGTSATNGVGNTGAGDQARTQYGGAVWDNRLYVTGGYNAAGAVQSTVFVSPQLNSGGNINSAWTSSTAFNVPRAGHTAVAYASNLYIFGGFDGTNYLTDTQYTAIGYKTGTISQTGNTVTGTGTSWVAGQNGKTIRYVTDGSSAIITSPPSATSLTVSASKTVAAGSRYLIDDGTVGSWTFGTSLPGGVRDAEGFAYNGYMYLVGGRSAASTCPPNTILSPISANTAILSGNNPSGVGEWFETNQKYAGDRYGAASVYIQGRLYLFGGGCSSFVPAGNRTYFSTLKSQPQVAKYSRLIDTDTDVFPTYWLLNGVDNSTGARWLMKYRTMHDISDGAGQQNPNEDCGTSATMPLMTGYGQETDFGQVTLGKPEVYLPKNSSGGNINCARYFNFSVNIDSQQAFGYPEDVTRGPTIADLSLFFTSDPSKRLRHGKTFTGGEQQPLDTPF
jgi:N-acetylneuraminic acid mutarotase